MKVIFLDFDGVFIIGGMVCNICVHYLNKILIETGAKIVITSDWRNQLSEFHLNGFLQDSGIKGEIIGKTEYIEQIDIIKQRELEISDFINKHNIKTWVIIDDLNLKMDNFVKTIFNIGISENEYKRVINILNVSY